MKKLTPLSAFSSYKISQESSKLVVGGLTTPSTSTGTSATSGFAGCTSDEKTVTWTTFDNGSSTSSVKIEACC
jgi:hypothetical protein